MVWHNFTRVLLCFKINRKVALDFDFDFEKLNRGDSLGYLEANGLARYEFLLIDL
jgi:hypothetical protein